MDSISIRDIDWDNRYFNPGGCALATYKPASADRLLHLLRLHFGPIRAHSLCCHHDPQVPEGAVIINNCAGCDRRFRSEYPGVRTISLWELLFGEPSIPGETDLDRYHGALNCYIDAH